MSLARATLIWTVVVAAVAVPIAAASASPLLAWRSAVYIAAGLAGVIALALLFFQPLLIGRYLPGLSAGHDRRAHRWVGGLLVAAVLIHVGGLWIASPPDVIDALLFASPTPFSAWGVIAMWALFAIAVMAVLRRPMRLRVRTWRVVHLCLAAVVVFATVVHAVLIVGTMETASKVALCALLVAATVKVMADLLVNSRRSKANH